jgi:hypothetical protein
MGNAGSAMVRFERAIEIGRASIVLAAAWELPKPIQLRDALRIVLVLLGSEPDRYPAAAARFGARLVTERRLTVTEAALCFAALQSLRSEDPVAGADALCALLEHHDEATAAGYLGDWIQRRGG